MSVKEILSHLFSVIPKEQIVFIIWYGNKKGEDVDLFVVLKGNVHFGSLSNIPLDVGYIGIAWIPMMIKYLDPIITEPLLTGDVIYGQVGQKEYYLLRQKIDADSSIYLLQCAEIFYEWAVKLAFENKLRESLFTLTFVHSYILYAFKYWSDNKIVTFKDLLHSDDGLLIMKNRKKAKQKLIFRSDVFLAFNQARKMLTDLRNVVGL